MHSFATVATLLVASASFVSAAPIACRGKPTNYADGYLEEYDVYHARYIALDCHSQHNSTFFDDCCHPLLANETLTGHRLEYCTPSNATLSSVTATIVEATASATATATASADVDAASEYSAAAESTSTSSAEAEATIAAAAWAPEQKQKSKSSSSEAPASTTEAAWTPEPTTEAPAQTSAAASSGSGEVHSGGFATYFYQGGNAGACGIVHSDSDKVIAMDTNGWYQDTGSASSHCGKWITITNTNNGKSVTAQVADACPTCVSDNSLDLSVGAFTAIASESDGMVPITWAWA